jgi:glutamate racemase
VDSGAAIARRTAWLLEHEAPDAKSADANLAYCMAVTPETVLLLPVLQRYGFGRSKNSRFNGVLSKKETVEKFFKIRACHF